MKTHVTLAALLILAGCDRSLVEPMRRIDLSQKTILASTCEEDTSINRYHHDPCVAYWLRKLYEQQKPTAEVPAKGCRRYSTKAWVYEGPKQTTGGR